MNKWNNIQNGTEVKYILDSILRKIKNKNIKRIFSFEDIILKKDDKVYSATSLEEPTYILFEDNDCLIIDFPFYSDLTIEYRKMEDWEKEKSISNVSNKAIDIINGHHKIYSWDFNNDGSRIEESLRIKEINDIKGIYGHINDYSVNSFHDKYEKWVNDCDKCFMITIPAGGDYFNQITFYMDNGLEITIKPQSAESDGYYDITIIDNNDVIDYQKIQK